MEGIAYYEQDHLLSLLSRVNYDFDNKYYVSANFRRDGALAWVQIIDGQTSGLFLLPGE